MILVLLQMGLICAVMGLFCAVVLGVIIWLDK